MHRLALLAPALLLLAACSQGATGGSPTAVVAAQPTAAPTAAPTHVADGQSSPTGAYPAPPGAPTPATSATPEAALPLTPDAPSPQLAPIEDVVRRYIAAQMANDGKAAGAEVDADPSRLAVSDFAKIRAFGKIQGVVFASYQRVDDSDIALSGAFDLIANDGRTGAGGFLAREHYALPANGPTRWLLTEFDFIQ